MLFLTFLSRDIQMLDSFQIFLFNRGQSADFVFAIFQFCFPYCLAMGNVSRPIQQRLSRRCQYGIKLMNEIGHLHWIVFNSLYLSKIKISRNQVIQNLQLFLRQVVLRNSCILQGRVVPTERRQSHKRLASISSFIYHFCSSMPMYDELDRSGAKLDYDQLGKMVGVPMVPVVAKTGKGLHDLLDTIIEVYENRDPRVRHIHINHSSVIEEEITNLTKPMHECPDLPRQFPPRYWAMKLLEQDKEAETILSTLPEYSAMVKIRDKGIGKIKKTLGEDVESAITSEKYGFIDGALKETFTPGQNDMNKQTRFIDKLVTNKWLGFPIFFGLMYVMFWCTFELGKYPQDWLAWCVARLSDWVSATMQTGPLKDLIVNGIIGGVGAVIVFLPNILILYLFISLMEDSGYMARAAFIMDKLMHGIGLHGKSFIPLIMGFGCNVPAIMATRTIESRSSRLITILINPFMSCSARLPVIVLLTAAFFPKHAALVMVSLYVLGILMSILTAKILRKTAFKKDETPFVMELPPYRVPTFRATMNHMKAQASMSDKNGTSSSIYPKTIWKLLLQPLP